MKIQFVQEHVIRGEKRSDDVFYKKDEVVDFGKDRVANTYAQAYIDRGYAVAYDDTAERAREKAKADAELEASEKAKAETKAKADADAKAKADAEAKAKSQQGGQQK